MYPHLSRGTLVRLEWRLGVGGPRPLPCPAQDIIAGGVGLLGMSSGGAAFSKWCCCLNPSDPPETVSAQVELTVTVTSENFTKELQNWSSPQFRKFNETFTKQVALEEQVPMATQFFPGSSLEGLRKQMRTMLEVCEFLSSPFPQGLPGREEKYKTGFHLEVPEGPRGRAAL